MPNTDKRRQIMVAAEKLFTTRRFHEITLDHVAQDAAVGKGTIYRYFKDKDDLFFQTAISGFDKLCELIEHAASENAPFQEQLSSILAEIARFFDSRRQLIRMMNSEEVRMATTGGDMRTRWLERRKSLVSALAKVLQRGTDAGLLRADIPADILSAYLLGMFRARGRDLEDAPPEGRATELIFDLFWHGAGKNGAGC